MAEVLHLVGARHLVVGHNVQRGGRARALCDGRCFIQCCCIVIALKYETPKTWYQAPTCSRVAARVRCATAGAFFGKLLVLRM